MALGYCHFRRGSMINTDRFSEQAPKMQGSRGIQGQALPENFLGFCRGAVSPLYKPYLRYVPPHRVGFLRRFGLTTGVHFAHFGLESGWVFEGTTGVYEHFYRFNSK